MNDRWLQPLFWVLTLLCCTTTSTPPNTHKTANTSDLPAPPASATKINPVMQKPIIGWSSQPQNRNREAYNFNSAGLKLHRANDYKAALVLFDKALIMDPNDLWARYNRACALSQLHQFEQALAELDQLLREDLPSFGPKLDQDNDLIPILQSPQVGPKLGQQREIITKAYQDILMRGVPAMTYHLLESDDDLDVSLQHKTYDDFQLGIYDPINQRFIPMTPVIPNALAGFLDRETNRALLISGQIIQGSMWVIQPNDLGVHLFALSQPGQLISQIEHLDRRHPLTQKERHGNSIAIDGDDIRITYHSVAYATRELTVKIHGSESTIIADTNEFTRPSSPSDHVQLNERQLTLNGHGAYINSPFPPKVNHKNGLITLGNNQVLDFKMIGDNQRIEQTPDGRYLLLLAQILDCNEDGERLYHRLARYDFTTQTLMSLSSGAFQIGATLGPDGSVFFDNGEEATRFPPGESKPVHDIPLGVRFMIPGYGYDCSI